MAMNASMVTTRFDELMSRIAPTMMMPEIALVTDMSGVCSVCETPPIT